MRKSQLAVAMFWVASVAFAAGFESNLEVQGITFRVTCPNDSSRPALTVVPGGLEIDNSPVTRKVDGEVVDAEVADLNVDGSPEVYVYVRSAGSGSYGSLIAFAANQLGRVVHQINKSARLIVLVVIGHIYVDPPDRRIGNNLTYSVLSRQPGKNTWGIYS